MAPKYLRPKNLSKALELMERYGQEAAIIAGGTAIVIMMKEKILAPNYLIDLRTVSGLDQIVRTSKGLEIGALVTHRQVETSPIVKRGAPILAEAFSTIGNVRIRNAGTIGGNLAYAEPQCNPPAILAAMDAEVNIANRRRNRVEKVSEFIKGIYESGLAEGELISHIAIPKISPKSRFSFIKFTTRSIEDKPAAVVAARLDFGKDKVCGDCRLIVGAVGPKTYRCHKAERILKGNTLNSRLIDEAAHKIVEEIEAMDDIYGSAWYKQELCTVLMRRAIEQARGA